MRVRVRGAGAGRDSEVCVPVRRTVEGGRRKERELSGPACVCGDEDVVVCPALSALLDVARVVREPPCQVILTDSAGIEHEACVVEQVERPFLDLVALVEVAVPQ